ncbi:MAG: response regulator [Muribaculaceae bacterium]|nr:response regulator [Muribaculaceae bacterium]
MEKHRADSIAGRYKSSIDSLIALRQFYQETDNTVGEMVVLKYLGQAYREDNKFIQAVEIHDAELKIASELCDTPAMIQALNNIGTNHRRMGILDDATKYHFSALNLCEKYSDKESYRSKKNRVVSLNGIGNISLRIGDNATADSVFRKALAGERELNSALGQAINYANLGAIFEEENMLDSAWVYYRKSMEMNIEAKSELGISLCHGHFGNLYEREGEIDKAIAEYEKAYQMEYKIDSWHWLNFCLALVDIYIEQNNYAKALQLLDKANQKATDGRSLDRLASIYGLYSIIYDKTGNTDKAYKAYRLSKTYNDSVLNQQNLISVQNERVKYEYQRRQQEIDTINNRFNSERQLRNVIIISLVVILLLLIIGVGMLMYLLKIKKREQAVMKQVDNMRSSFFTNITHEFRTPLTVIIGLAERIAGNESVENLKSIGETISRQGHNLLLLINQILDVSKLKSSVSHSEYQHGDIIGYIHLIFEGAKVLANRKNIEYRFKPQEKSVEMDFIPDYITKIVGNLISNAIKFTPANGQVTISTATKNKRFILTVQDNGCGISTHDLPYIFDAFYQGNSNSRSMGTGIGLSLVKQLVEAMNGTVAVESGENNGTKFTVNLPISHTVNQVVSLNELPAVNDIFVTDGDEAESVEIDDDTLTRILIVEDNNDVSSFIGSVINNANIYYAQNGREGLEKALQIVPDVIITDIMMPEMDGIEMCDKIRESDILCHIPIIIISAKAEEYDKIEGIKSGADAYLYKPFNAEELNVTINSLLERRKLLQENYTRNSAKDSVSTEKLSTNDQVFLNKVIDLTHAQMATQSVNINDLAESLNMTSRQLNRKINAITGDNISKYILQVRMLRAKQLLDSNKDYTIAEVAYKCGYEENSNFTRAFKMLYGITPTQYRKMPN